MHREERKWPVGTERCHATLLLNAESLSVISGWLSACSTTKRKNIITSRFIFAMVALIRNKWVVLLKCILIYFCLIKLFVFFWNRLKNKENKGSNHGSFIMSMKTSCEGSSLCRMFQAGLLRWAQIRCVELKFSPINLFVFSSDTLQSCFVDP